MNSENQPIFVYTGPDQYDQLNYKMLNLRTLCKNIDRLANDMKRRNVNHIVELSRLVNRCLHPNNLTEEELNRRMEEVHRKSVEFRNIIVMHKGHFKRLLTRMHEIVEEIFECAQAIGMENVTDGLRTRYNEALHKYHVFNRIQLTRRVNSGCNRTPYSYGTRFNH